MGLVSGLATPPPPSPPPIPAFPGFSDRVLAYTFDQGRVYPERKEQAPFPRRRRGRRMRPALEFRDRVRLVATVWCFRELWPTPRPRAGMAARYYPRGYVAAAPAREEC